MHRPIFYESLQDRINSVVERGALVRDAPLSTVADSLDLVELALDLEEMDTQIVVRIKTAGEFLGLVKLIEFRRSKANARK